MSTSQLTTFIRSWEGPKWKSSHSRVVTDLLQVLMHPGKLSPLSLVFPLLHSSKRTSASSMSASLSLLIVSATIISPPEAFFDLKISFASDVWALECMIFDKLRRERVSGKVTNSHLLSGKLPLLPSNLNI